MRRPSSPSPEGKGTSSARLSQTFLHLQGKNHRWKQLTHAGSGAHPSLKSPPAGTRSGQKGGGPEGGILGFPKQNGF